MKNLDKYELKGEWIVLIREILNGDIPLVADHFKYFAAVLRADDITKLAGRFVSIRKGNHGL